MSADMVATRDAIVNALVGKTIGDMESVGRLTAEEIADALSGVVRDPATLADDEALRWGLARRMARAIGDSDDPITLGAYDGEAERTLRALTAALTDGGGA